MKSREREERKKILRRILAIVILITDLGQERDGRNARGEREKETNILHCAAIENLNLVVERAV